MAATPLAPAEPVPSSSGLGPVVPEADRRAATKATKSGFAARPARTLGDGDRFIYSEDAGGRGDGDKFRDGTKWRWELTRDEWGGARQGDGEWESAGSWKTEVGGKAGGEGGL